MFVEKIVFVKLFEYVRRSFVFSAMVFGGHIFHEIAFWFYLSHSPTQREVLAQQVRHPGRRHSGVFVINGSVASEAHSCSAGLCHLVPLGWCLAER